MVAPWHTPVGQGAHMRGAVGALSPFLRVLRKSSSLCALFCRSVYGIPVTFIQPLHPALLFDRDRFYGHDDDFER